mmetsp:Transcript_16761/g.37811  ORF Transcript_16761/g.37811 Transcript_16761/m.37811 type:complete len:136 (-) Transcript_16761:59-466(-)
MARRRTHGLLLPVACLLAAVAATLVAAQAFIPGAQSRWQAAVARVPRGAAASLVLRWAAGADQGTEAAGAGTGEAEEEPDAGKEAKKSEGLNVISILGSILVFVFGSATVVFLVVPLVVLAYKAATGEALISLEG